MITLYHILELTGKALRRELSDEEKNVLAVAIGATLAESEALADKWRTALRRFAIRRHQRLAGGGTFVPNGGSCAVCKAEWNEDEAERHVPGCLLERTQ